MTMVHVGASVEIHQSAPIHTSMIHILASVFAIHMHVRHISTLTTKPVAASVVKNQPAQAINTTMTHRANATAVMSLGAVQENTTIITHVTANVKIHQLAMLHIIMIQTHVSVLADLMIAILANTLTIRAVVVSAQSTRPAQTINTSMVQLASVSVKT